MSRRSSNRPNYHAGRGGAQWGKGRFNRTPVPELEAPRRSGFRGTGGKSRRPNVTQNVVPEVPIRSEVPPLPTPKHLSKKSSELSNDPLYLESFMNEMGTERRRAPQINEVHPGYFGFPRLIEEDHKSATARSHIYGKNVSESMHAYYVGMNLHARMLNIYRKIF